MLALRPFSLLFAAALAAALLPACDGCGTKGSLASVPEGLRVPVLIDGQEAMAIDAATLSKVTPDFVDGERHSWRLKALLGERYPSGAQIEIEDAEGKRAAIEPATDGREPTFAINRTGEVRISVVKPDEPFPPFHGRGGNRGRAGEPGRVREVKRIWLTSVGAKEDGAHRDTEPVVGPPVTLLASIDGAPAVTWTRAELAKVKPLAQPSEDGDGEREIWPLRDIARVMVGPTARITQLTGDGGASLAIEESAWADATRVPVLRANRRGLLKFLWLTPELSPMGGQQLRGVTSLQIVGGP